MAAGNAANVTTGKHRVDGGIYFAPVGSTLPTDAATALDDELYTNLGFISEDGVTIQETRTSEELKEWNGDVIDVLTSEHTVKFQAKFLESIKLEVLKMVYGDDNVTEDNGKITVKVNSEELDEYVFVIDTVIKGNRKQRRIFPRGKLSELGDTVLKAGEAVAYDVTITAFVGEDGDKGKIYIE